MIRTIETGRLSEHRGDNCAWAGGLAGRRHDHPLSDDREFCWRGRGDAASPAGRLTLASACRRTELQGRSFVDMDVDRAGFKVLEAWVSA